jgi:hypothetical protein
MVSLLAASGCRFGWIAMGLPPRQGPKVHALSLGESVLVLVAFVLVVYCTIRIGAWLVPKIDSIILFRELRRELDPRRRRSK